MASDSPPHTRALGAYMSCLRMNKSSGLVALLICASITAFAQDRPVAIHSYEDTSCGAWVKSAHNSAVRAQYSSWFRGFVSGYNYGKPDNQVQLGRLPDPETLALYVDKFCRENPLQPFFVTAFRLVDELRDQPSPPGPPTAKP